MTPSAEYNKSPVDTHREMDSPRDDPFQHAVAEVQLPAPADFVGSVREKLCLIHQNYPHKRSTVDSCLRGLENEPTMVEILVAAYVLNGGVSLKFHTQTEQQEEDEKDLDALLHDIEGSFRDVWADSAEKKNDK